MYAIIYILNINNALVCTFQSRLVLHPSEMSTEDEIFNLLQIGGVLAIIYVQCGC